MSDYPAFGAIPRLHRDITITEKIDGTNGLISIDPNNLIADWANGQELGKGIVVHAAGQQFFVQTGSRNRWIAPEDDNFGFAAWVRANAQALVDTLGPGNHYGEWWGSGIQRGYGLTKGEKRFSLFNTLRWKDADLSAVPGLGVVPVLAVHNGVDMNYLVSEAIQDLVVKGSVAAPGFMKPEGVVVYHHAAKQYFKATIEKDQEPKSLRKSA